MRPIRAARLLAAAVLAAAPIAGPGTARGHEEGVLHLESQRIPAGGEIAVRGESLPEEAKLSLVLRGPLSTLPLGEVETTPDGTFEARLPLPDDADPGRWEVVAIARDGDEVGRVELVVAAAGAGAERPGLAEPGREPTAAAMDLPTSRGPIEWTVIAGFVALAALGGAALLRQG